MATRVASYGLAVSVEVVELSPSVLDSGTEARYTCVGLPCGDMSVRK